MANMSDIEARIAALEAWQRKLQGAPQFPAAGAFRLSPTSVERLRGVHPDLQAVVHYALRVSDVDFGIPPSGGLRMAAEQAQLMAQGKTRTLDSRHLTGHAVDIYAYVGGAASYRQEHVLAVHAAFLRASAALLVPLRWGGDWNGDGVTSTNENDLVHHELPRDVYGETHAVRSQLAAAFLAEVSP